MVAWVEDLARPRPGGDHAREPLADRLGPLLDCRSGVALIEFAAVTWATIDSPWLHKVDKDAFASELDTIRTIAPNLILSNHLPPAPGRLMERFLGSLAAAPGAHPFVGPNQAAFEQMLKQMSAAPV